MKTQHFIIVLAAVAILFTACKPDKEEPEIPIPVTGITLNYAELTLIPKDTITLIAAVQPDNADNKTVTWTSSNPAVAIVNNNGFVETLTKGKTTITATTQDGDKKATCMITVKDYRSQWVGDWDFTTYHLGHIGLGEQDDVICMKFFEQGQPQNVKVNENGELLEIIPHSTLYIYGKFEGVNKVHFVFGEHSMGAPFEVTVNGTKKEGDKK